MMRLVITKWVAILVVGWGGTGLAATFTWVGAAGTTGNWFEASNWDVGSGYPDAGDRAVMGTPGAAVMLTNETGFLDSLELLAGTLIFSNWTTRVQATNVTVRGVMTLPAAFTNDSTSNRVWIVCSNFELAVEGRINVDGLGYIGDCGPGRSAGISAAPSAGAGHGAAGGMTYRGVDQQTYLLGGLEYGSISEPSMPGSGSGTPGSSGIVGRPGGGVVRIEASGHVLLNGVISANGLDGLAGSQARNAGGGSGGSVWISCGTFAGTNGEIRANGGAGATSTYVDTGVSYTKSSGGGAGGRLAVHYDPIAQAALTLPTICLTAGPGRGGAYPPRPLAAPPTILSNTWASYFDHTLEAGWGSLYVSDSSGLVRLTETMSNLSGLVTFGDGATNFILNSLALENAYFGVGTGAVITITGALSTATNAGLIARHPLALAVGGAAVLRGETRFDSALAFSCQGGLTVQDAGEFSALQGSILAVSGGMTLSGNQANVMWKGVDAVITGDVRIAQGAWLAAMGYGTNGTVGDAAMRLDVNGELRLESNAWIYVYADPKAGGSPFFECDTLVIDEGGGFNGDARGYAYIHGPGHGGNASPGGGGGHGGRGGNSSAGATGGATNDHARLPAFPGGTGGFPVSYLTGQGGALIRLRVRGPAVIDGVITVNGQTPYGTIANGRVGGAGAGGAILLVTGWTISGGNQAALRANGASGETNATYAAGGGGGGRIAVYVNIREALYPQVMAGDITGLQSNSVIHGFSGAVSVFGGTGFESGGVGSVCIYRIPPPMGTVLTVR